MTLVLVALAAGTARGAAPAATEQAKTVEDDWMRQYASFEAATAPRKLPKGSPPPAVPAADEVQPAVMKKYLPLLVQRGQKLLAALDDRAAGEHRDRLARLAGRVAAVDEATPIDTLAALHLDLRRAIREMFFANPKLDLDRLVFYKRRNGRCFPDVSSISMVWVGSPGGDIYVLDLDRKGNVKSLRPLIGGRLPTGHVHGIDLHWDARRIVFGYVESDQDFSRSACRPGHEAWLKSGPGRIHEINLDGTGLRQITRSERFHDTAPTYLPDGGVAFMSDRALSGIQCNQPGHDEMFANLYACNADGSGLFRLANNANGDYNPHTLDDGRVGFMRWEYNERHSNVTHAFWAMRPDGTQAEPVFGQHIDTPDMIVDARNIPGSRRYVAIASAHYNFERGMIVVLDPARGINNVADGLRTIPSGREGQLLRWANGQGGAPTGSPWGFFTTPTALSEDLVLCAYDYSTGQHDPAGFGLYLVDANGNQELLYRDSQFACLQPIPLKARPVPPVLPRQRAEGKPAMCALENVYDGSDFLRPGEAKYLRIVENLVWPYTVEDGEMRYRYADYQCENWTAKRIVGDVPIEADGSVAFTVPVDQALYFQLLDADRREIRRMRSWASFQPGERRGCVGCHETRGEAPRPVTRDAARYAPRQPTPAVSWGDKPVNFLRDIQPIFDQHCVRCHGGLKPKGGWDLSGGLTLKYNVAYESLLGYRPSGAKPFAAANPWRATPMLASTPRLDNPIAPTTPRKFGSTQARLMKVIEGDAHRQRAKLSPQQMIDLTAWIDLNGPYHDRCFSKRRNPSAVPVVTPAATAVFKARCAECHTVKDLTRPDWIDIANPERSRFLVAPPAKAAGGAERCGRPVFADRGDADYASLLAWARQQAAAAWAKPRRDVMGLIEAGRTPPWFKEMPPAAAREPLARANPIRKPPLPNSPKPDNLAPKAAVTVSSEYDPGFAGKCIVDGWCGQHERGEWASKSETKPWVRLEWKEPVTVARVVLYDRANPSDHAKAGRLTFSEGDPVAVGDIPNDGSPRAVAIPPRKVKWLKFEVTVSAGANVGLSEIEVFVTPVPGASQRVPS